MKILHTPLNIANDGISVVRGLRELGHEAELAAISTSKYVEPGTIDLSFSRYGSLQRQLKKIRFVQEEMPKYDVVHFHAGRSILDYGEGRFSLLDLKYAHDNGQVVATTFHGCEVRELQEGGCPWPCDNPVCKQGDKRARLEKFLKYADLLYVTTPDLLPAVPGAQLLPQSVSGLEETEVSPAQSLLPVKVVHTPSLRATKGTDVIERIINKLIEEGLDIDFRIVENATHDEALKAIAQADIFIDQINIGWYGVATIEAASMGKPVVVRIDDEYIKLSGMSKPPFISATKETLEQQIRLLYNEREALPALGSANRQFVLHRHSPLINAKRLIGDYEKILSEKPVRKR